jgi:hypothetical protein
MIKVGWGLVLFNAFVWVAYYAQESSQPFGTILPMIQSADFSQFGSTLSWLIGMNIFSVVSILISFIVYKKENDSTSLRLMIAATSLLVISIITY